MCDSFICFYAEINRLNERTSSIEITTHYTEVDESRGDDYPRKFKLCDVCLYQRFEEPLYTYRWCQTLMCDGVVVDGKHYVCYECMKTFEEYVKHAKGDES